MTVVQMPLRPRRASLVKDTPAEIVKHPNSTVDFVKDAIDQIEADAKMRNAKEEADSAMRVIQQDLALCILKAEALANMHDRREHAVFLFETARARLKEQLFGK